MPTKHPSNSDTKLAENNSTPKLSSRLRDVFGKVCAITSLVGTLVFYTGAAGRTADIYKNYGESEKSWEETPASDVLKVRDGSMMDWGSTLGACAVSLSAGFTGIALGRKRRREEASQEGGSYSNDGFFDGYMFGSIFNSRSSSSSSSSGNAKGLLAAGAVFVLGVLAVGTAAVTYKSMKTNFGD